MKIAILTRGFNSEKGGAERFTSCLCKEFKKSGHEIHIFSGDHNSVSDEYKIINVNYKKYFSWLKVLSFSREVRKLIKDSDYDIVYGHCQAYPIDFFYAGGGVHKKWMQIYAESFLLRIIKYILSPVHLAMCFIEKMIFKKSSSTQIITNSQLVKNHILRAYDTPEENISVIYDGVDHSCFNKDNRKYRTRIIKEASFNDDDIVLLHISNNWNRKGLRTIINSMKLLGDNYKLIVVGRGPVKKWQKIIKNAGLNSKRIYFAGTTDDVYKYYGASDVFILPTMYDPCSQVVREAMACGVIPVTTTLNGASEMIDDRESGFIMNSYKDQNFLAGILSDIEDENVRNSFKEKAYNKSLEYSWGRCAEEHLSLFSKIKSAKN